MALEAAIRLLLVARGHPYDRTAFMAMFEGDHGLDATLVEQPAAQLVLRPEHAGRWDAVLFYDMSGIAMPGQAPVAVPDDYRASIEALLERGTGILLLNHGLLSWPDWPLWRSLSGTSFMLTEGELHGERLPGSGFRGGPSDPAHETSVRLRSATPEHPVLEGLAEGFEITDELYLKTAGFEASVLPLLRAEYAFVQENFRPPPLASPEEQAHWQHPPGSDLVVWAHAAYRSPVVAMDLGDGPSAYGNPGFRRLVGNAVRWVASEAARRWAADQSAAGAV